MKEIITNSVDETEQLAKDFVITELQKGMIICLGGELGAGKTTFVQGLLKYCGAIGPYTSPTFNLVKEYVVDFQEIKKIYHIDAYRINAQDLESIGWHEIKNNKDAVVLIEWFENIKEVLPQNVYMILCEGITQTKHKYIFKN